MHTGQVVSFEALARCPHRYKGFIQPYTDTFIPLAEDSGLIIDLGRAVLLEACQLRRSVLLRLWIRRRINRAISETSVLVKESRPRD